MKDKTKRESFAAELAKDDFEIDDPDDKRRILLARDRQENIGGVIGLSVARFIHVVTYGKFAKISRKKGDVGNTKESSAEDFFMVWWETKHIMSVEKRKKTARAGDIVLRRTRDFVWNYSSGKYKAGYARVRQRGSGKCKAGYAKVRQYMLGVRTDRKCEYCGKVFSDRSGLTRHLRNAVCQPKKKKEKEKFVCRVVGCGKSFETTSGLTRHVNLKHNNEKFTCPHCSKGFSSKDSLKMHVARYHPKHAKPCHFKDNTEHHVCMSGYGACRRVPADDNILKAIRGKDCCESCYRHFFKDQHVL